MSGTIRTSSLASQTREALMRMIGGMDLSRDNKLPREEELARILGVSRTTVRQALNDLAADGIVLRRQGRGTFVNVASLGIRARFSPSTELTDAIRASGHEPEVRLLGTRETIGAVAARLRGVLGAPADEPVLEVTKLFCADGRMCAACRDWLALSSTGCETATDALAALKGYGGSLFRFVRERGGRAIEWDKAEIDVAEPAEVLALSDALAPADVGARPYLLVRSVIYDGDDAPVVVAEEYVDTSVVTFDLIRRKQIS